MRLRVGFLFLLLSVMSALSCPWCQRYGVKETVSAGEPDAGGLYFGAPPPEEKTRRYYLAAEPVLWEWVPGGKNLSKDVPLPPQIVSRPTSARLRYVQYTDATFTARMPTPSQQGLLGPTLRGVAGEYLAVTFLNRTPQPLSIHPHGVRYDKDSEGAYYLPTLGKGAAVGSQARFTYVWHLDAASAPQADEPSSKAWLYHSHCKDEEEVNAGLAGLIVVTDPARARPDGTPQDVDREFAVAFQIFEEEDDETEERVEEGLPPATFEQTMRAQELGARHAINGRLFGTLRGLEMMEGERVRWYLAALGDETGLHTAHWHGARVREEGRRTVDVVALLPGETKVADLLADNPGTWLLHCHVSDHMMEGMFAPFVIHPRDGKVEGAAFLGAPVGASTLRWQEMAGTLDFSKGAREPMTLTLRATVPVPAGFFLPKGQMVIRVGEREVPLLPTGAGYTELRAEGVLFSALNANQFGVVRADEMEFRVTFTGADWRLAFGLDPDGALEETLECRIGQATHRAPLPLRITRDGDRGKVEMRRP
jgi:hypothetical protein